MGTMPVKRLLITMSLPMMASMLVQALYNIVDSIFVSRIGEDALTAVSLAFPVQTLMIAVGGGTGVGVNALLSKSLGEKKLKAANQAANMGVFLMAISYVGFCLVGIFGARPFFESQVDMSLPNASAIVEYGTSYLRICLTASVGILFEMMFERLLQATGKTIYTMITQGTGAIINIILDPILIFGYFGAPEMGIAGAATATVIGQIIAMILAATFNVKKNTEIHLSLKNMRPKAATIRTIYWVGVPSIIMQAIGSVMTYGMNKILAPFSTTAVAVFGVYFKLNSFIFMPVFGLNNGLIPIVAYNYGARKKERIVQAVRFAIMIAVSIMFIGCCIFQLAPKYLLMLFDASPQMLEIGVPALRIIGTHFVLAGCSIVLMSTFQAFGQGFLSLTVSALRQLVIILPVAYLLAHYIGLSAIWWSFPIAEAVALSLSIFFFTRLYRKKIKTL
jgi:putative MATE family efflux protein